MGKNELNRRFGVTDEQLDEWADEYKGADWSNMRFGEVISSRPRVADEPLDSITVKIPRSGAVAMRKIQEETGMTRSEFVCSAIDDKLLTMS